MKIDVAMELSNIIKKNLDILSFLLKSKYIAKTTCISRCRGKNAVEMDKNGDFYRTEAPTLAYILFKKNSKIRETGTGEFEFAGFLPGIYKRKLDKDNICVLIVDDKISTIDAQRVDKMITPMTISISIVYNFYFIGRDCQKWMTKLIGKALDINERWNRLSIYYNKNKIYITNPYDDNNSGLQVVKPIDELILKDDQRSDILNTIDRFIKNKEFYEHHNLKYKVGILLHGDPGTGKSSVAQAIALKYHAKLAIISRNDIRDGLYHVYNERILAVLCIEEIDTLLETKVNKTETGTDVTVRGLGKEEITTWIDNIPNNTILIATTNHLDRIMEFEPSIVRTGRFDLKVEFTKFDKEDAIQMVRLYGLNDSFVDQFEYPLAPVDLQFAIIQEFGRQALLKGDE